MRRSVGPSVCASVCPSVRPSSKWSDLLQLKTKMFPFRRRVMPAVPRTAGLSCTAKYMLLKTTAADTIRHVEVCILLTGHMGRILREINYRNNDAPVCWMRLLR